MRSVLSNINSEGAGEQGAVVLPAPSRVRVRDCVHACVSIVTEISFPAALWLLATPPSTITRDSTFHLVNYPLNARNNKKKQQKALKTSFAAVVA